MVQAGIGLDTPRTNLGDATYLTNQPDFDISQEKSFQSPSKDNNDLLQQLQNGRRGAMNLKTPRTRVPFGDRRNIPNALGGGEFTPLLKSATRNSAMKYGKENGVPQTPAFLKPGGLDDIAEDLSPVPQLGSSIYNDSRNGSYVNGTPIPQVESSSAASTPLALLPRRSDGSNVLQDGNQLSLREQENIIDKIEKENFGLKLKIHFLEEALRKAGPGFSEAALKENTELKVDKVTLQKELHRYRRTLTTAESDLEAYRQQMLEIQEKAKRKYADEGAREELDHLRRLLDDKEQELQEFSIKLRDAERQESQLEKLRDDMGDLEADIREKDRIIDEREDELETLKEKVKEREDELADLEDSLKAAKRREIELEEKAQLGDDMDEAKETIAELKHEIERLTQEIEAAKEDQQEAVSEKERAAADLQELQDEMANKSITTKGLGRQIEEKANRLQDEVENLRDSNSSLEGKLSEKTQSFETLERKFEELERDAAGREKEFKLVQQDLQSVKDALQRTTDEKDLLQVRHDVLTSESADLQRQLAKARSSIEDLEDKLDEEKTLAVRGEREVRDEYKTEIDRLNDELEDLRADIREKERIHDDDSDKWDSERRKLKSEADRAEEQAAGLQRTIDKLQESEGSLSGKEMKIQKAFDSEKERHASEKASLSDQIETLNTDLQVREKVIDETRSELSSVREELRLSQREQKSLLEKIEGLEDEIEVMQTALEEQNEQARLDLDAAQEEIARLTEQLDLTRSGNGDNLDSREDWPAKVRVLESQLEKAKKEKQELQDQFALSNIEIHSLRTESAEIEAQRDELKSQLKDLKQQEDTFRILDQEKVELRTSKMKLDNEVRRLREEARILNEQQQHTEKQSQDEIERASAEELRLVTNIGELQKKLSGSPNKELVVAKHTIQRLELQVQDLELQLHSSNDPNAVDPELSILRHDLSAARRKEKEYVERELAQKDILRSLKRQVSELERRAQGADTSRLQVNSPRASTSETAGKNEMIEVRHQLATAHQNLTELRSRLKEAESDWGFEKQTLEQTITRLRSKIDRLERELQHERQLHNDSEDRTMALERRDLHEMLKEAQLQAEELELLLKARDAALSKATATESDLRKQLNRIRDERAAQRDRAVRSTRELELVEKDFRHARLAWEDEKRALSRGVRFPNMSVSEIRGNESLIREGEEKDKRHAKELRGLAMQIEWLRARCRREEGLRADAAYAKRFMLLQVELFGACNTADLHMLQQMGITPDRSLIANNRKSPATTFRTVAILIRATVRMKRAAEAWAKSRNIHDRLVERLEGMKRKSLIAGVAKGDAGVGYGGGRHEETRKSPRSSMRRSGGDGRM